VGACPHGGAVADLAEPVLGDRIGDVALPLQPDEREAIAEESWAEDIALDAQRESRFSSVALAATVLRGPSDCLDAAVAPRPLDAACPLR
jgi:hypothetical protein